MKLFTLLWRNHRRTEWDHSHSKNISLLSLNLSPKEKSSSPVKSLSQKDPLLFSSPPIASSISVARSLLSEKENLLQSPVLPDLQQGFGAGCCTSIHIKAGSPPPSPSPSNCARRSKGQSEDKCEGQQTAVLGEDVFHLRTCSAKPRR